jgi:hypothetical protein
MVDIGLILGNVIRSRGGMALHYGSAIQLRDLSATGYCSYLFSLLLFFAQDLEVVSRASFLDYFQSYEVVL